MARLFPDDPYEVAFSGTADFTVELGKSQSAGAFRAVLPCAPGAVAPPFTLSGVHTADVSLSRPVPLGDVYQVRMFPREPGQLHGHGAICWVSSTSRA